MADFENDELGDLDNLSMTLSAGEADWLLSAFASATPSAVAPPLTSSPSSSDHLSLPSSLSMGSPDSVLPLPIQSTPRLPPGRDPRRLRANESRYRQDISYLFEELATLTGSQEQKLNRRNVLQGAIKKLRHAQTQASPLPVDHRLLFVADATPMAILALDGRYLDANDALLKAYQISLGDLKQKTLFSKVDHCPEVMAEYFVVYQRLMTRRPVEAALEEEMDVQCPKTQSVYRPAGYLLTQYFKIYFDAQGRPVYVTFRLSPRRGPALPQHTRQ